MMKTTVLLLCLFLSSPVLAQLGFCEGSKGDPIFHEDFVTGSGTGEPLPADLTSYTFVSGDPNDGQYTISDRIGQNNGSWHPSLPGTTVSRGRALIVNASFTAGQFYRTNITGLCQNTTYEFSAYLMNVYDPDSRACENGGIPNNVRFEIWDKTESNLLSQGNTGDIVSTSNPEWKHFGLTFRSETGQDAVILKMFNNGAGGCGNDLAIDDIIFRSCGDLTEVTQADTSLKALRVCEEDTPVRVNLMATSDSSVYTTQFYQWQQSPDGSSWEDIPGETAESFQSPNLSSTVHFRVKVAEDPLNLLDNLCSSASEPFTVKIVMTPVAPINLGDVQVCSNQSSPGLKAEGKDDEEIFWYDAATGGNLLAENSSAFFPMETGIYFAEARKKGAYGCNPGPRTAISFTVLQAPEAEDEILYLCENSSLPLDARLENMTYVWSTGETTRAIVVSEAGSYEVTITNSSGCTVTKTTEVIAVSSPIIRNIISEEGAVTIELEQDGPFDFSLDGASFQTSNHFPEVPGGIFTAFVKDRQGCTVKTKDFAHLVLPKYISPNNDGYNDFFELKGVSFFGASRIEVFDRYGKLMASGEGANFRWDGKFSGKALPSEDFWYHIKIEGFSPIIGHFSLIR